MMGRSAAGGVEGRTVRRRRVPRAVGLGLATLLAGLVGLASPVASAGGPAAQASAAAACPAATVVGLRTGRHPSYDRLVIDLRCRLPRYTVRYVRQVTADPSGLPVRLLGRAFLLIILSPANAHTAAGVRTLRGPTILTPRLPTLRQVKLVGDFEAYVSIAVGLAHRVPVHPFTLTGPLRLVVDLGH